MAFNPWIPITELAISYPDFQWGAVANPDEIDINNAEIVGKLNNLINKVNARFSATELPYTDGSVITRHYADGSIIDSKISATANIAQMKINSTTGWISTSLSTANSNATLAVNTANSAETKANSAVTTATSAEAKADNAVSTANSAFISAGDASTDANGALVVVNALTEDYSAKLPAIEAGITSIAEKVDKSYVDALISDLTVGVMPEGSVDDVKLSNAVGMVKDKLNKLTYLNTIGNREVTVFMGDGSIITTTYNASNAVLKTSTTVFPNADTIVELVEYTNGTAYESTTTFNVDGSITTQVNAPTPVG